MDRPSHRTCCVRQLRSARLRNFRVHAAGVTAICLAFGQSAFACDLAAQGDGRVAAIIDGRTMRLDDGREIRLAGIELPVGSQDRQHAHAALAALTEGRAVSLRGSDDAPDRYGRQTGFAFGDRAETSIQTALLEQGAAMMSPMIDATCLPQLSEAENIARRARRGIWANPAALKNAERPGDILTALGQFGVVEGKVLSVRQAGAVTYVNFGRRWTQDFAVTLSKRTVTAFEEAQITVKSFENRNIRVRGWIGQRGGPRIEVFRVEQIDVLGENESSPGRGRVQGGLKTN